MRRRYESERTWRERGPNPAASSERHQDDRDGYGEYPGQFGGDYDDAERRFGEHHPYPGREHDSGGSGRRTERGGHARPASGFRGVGPRGYVRSDERIREEICELLTAEDVDVSDVDVSVSTGEVTLSGMVDDRRTKRDVEDLAEGISGVRDVNNQIRVRSGAEAERPRDSNARGANRTDENENRPH